MTSWASPSKIPCRRSGIIRIELATRPTDGESRGVQADGQATEITSRFAAQLPRISSLVDADLDAAYLIVAGLMRLSRQREDTFRPLCWNCG